MLPACMCEKALTGRNNAPHMSYGGSEAINTLIDY